MSEKKIEINESLLNKNICELHLSIRARGALSRRQINTIKEALNLSKADLRKIRNLGIVTENEILNSLDAYLRTTCNISLLDYHKMIHPNNFEDYMPESYFCGRYL